MTNILSNLNNSQNTTIEQVVHVATWPSLAMARQQLFLLQTLYGTDVRRVLVNVDDPRCGDVWPVQRLAEKSRSRSSTPGLV